MFNKDVVVPGRMRRRIENPRILLLDCPLEYKKGENQTNVELTKEEDWCGWGGRRVRPSAGEQHHRLGKHVLRQPTQGRAAMHPAHLCTPARVALCAFSCSVWLSMAVVPGLRC